MSAFSVKPDIENIRVEGAVIRFTIWTQGIDLVPKTMRFTANSLSCRLKHETLNHRVRGSSPGAPQALQALSRLHRLKRAD